MEILDEIVCDDCKSKNVKRKTIFILYNGKPRKAYKYVCLDCGNEWKEISF